MKVNPRVALGPVLDYLAAKAIGDLAEQGGQVHVVNGVLRYYDDAIDELYSPSTNWSHGGPICEAKGIFPALTNMERLDNGQVVFEKSFEAKTAQMYLDFEDSIPGPTPLSASMRCLAVSTFGDEAEVPDELC